MPEEQEISPEEAKKHIGTDIKTFQQQQDLYQATVYTWGTKPGAHKLTNQAKGILFGGSLGHASMQVTFPADERGDELINKYCKNDTNSTQIPYNKILKKYRYNGIIKNTYYYEVYFSVRPDDKQRIVLETLQGDQINARADNADYNYTKYAPQYPSHLIEHRTSKGLLKNKHITLAPMLLITRPEQDNSLFSKKINEILNILEKIYSQIKLHKDEIYKIKNNIKTFKKPLTDSQKDQISQQQFLINKKQEEIKINITKLKNTYTDWIKYMPELDKYVTIGKIPDSKLSLSVKDFTKKNSNIGAGLDLESMLATMKKIVTDEKTFDLLNKNCSSTVLTILNSGIAPKDKKTVGKHVPEVKNYQDDSDPFFKMLTPQSVDTAASSMDEKFMQQQGITTKEKSIKAAIKKLQNSRKPISITSFNNLLKRTKKYFVNKKPLKSSAKKDTLLFSMPHTTKRTRFYKKDTSEETTPLIPKSSSHR